jgi:S1-C subfamily serine protease
MALSLRGAKITNVKFLQHIEPLALDLSDTPITDLRPLQGKKLVELYLENTQVQDLSPIRGMPLEKLYLSRTPVRDLSALEGMPLVELNAVECPIGDISGIAKSPIQMLWLTGCPVEDISALKTVPLVSVTLHRTKVKNLAPLTGTALQRLHIAETPVTDLSPLKGMQLTRLVFTPRNITKGIEIARELSLQEIGTQFDEARKDLQPPAAFWPAYDAAHSPPPNNRPSITSEPSPKHGTNPIPECIRAAKKTGSGFFVGHEGYFVTNAHVVDAANKVYVFLDDMKVPAKIVHTGRTADLAILKTDKIVLGFALKDQDVEAGTDVFAIGFPNPDVQGLDPKVTKGVISGTKGLENDDTKFQIDAAIQPGNSGGPLCDYNGNLVGVVVETLNSKFMIQTKGVIPQNVNYAIKASELAAFLRSRSVNSEAPAPVVGAEGGLRTAIGKAALVIVE